MDLGTINCDKNILPQILPRFRNWEQAKGCQSFCEYAGAKTYT